MRYAIDAKGLCKRYGDVVAVSSLDLQVKGGELFALLGVNGAGKTTAIKMLSCLISPTSGSADVMGHSIIGEANMVKAAVSVSPQESSVAQNLTVFENLAFIAQIYGASSLEARKAADEMIEMLSLGEVRNRFAKKLSGGYARRLSIAMALITKPQVLFLDEPTLGLDVLARRELWKIIREIKGQVTILLTTHYLEEAEALSDRVGIMAKGQMLAIGTADEIKAFAGTDNFEEAFIRLASGKYCAKKGTFGDFGGGEV
ncbi:MAG: ATP-binding cassette domain-containing protein [Clostridia bacterium]|nr:ATP-binding cassette domain-containing protein [Clostridia bacterium]